jgi:hypothetical protein
MNAMSKCLGAKVVVMFMMATAFAQKKPAIQRLGPDDLPVINSTVILLPEGEEVSDLTCGDQELWVIEVKDNAVYVKPSKEGLTTNVNIISKSKSIYSFIIREVTKQGKAAEKPDVRVTLAGDEALKLRKDREELEEALARSERQVKELTEKAENLKKKSEPPPPPVVIPEPPKPIPAEVKPVEVVAPLQAATEEPAEPIVRSYVIERKEGVVTKGVKALGRILGRVRRALRIL